MAQSVYYLPQVIDGPAAGGNLRTTILLANTSATKADVTIALTADDGSPRSLNFPALGAGSQFSLTLPPGASQILQTDGSGDGSAGAATVSSSNALGVSTIISAYDSNGNPLSESGAASSDVYTGYLIPIDTTGGLNTGVGIFNPSTAPLTLTFTLFDSTGTNVETATATLGAGGHMARLAAGDLFPDVNGVQGTLAVTASAPVAAVTFRQNTGSNVYTLLDAVPQVSLSLNFYLPQIADGPNVAGTLQTSFILYNLSAKPAAVTLSLSQDSGAPWVVNIPGVGNNSTFTITLAAGGSAFLQTDGQGVYTLGAASISSTQPIGVAAVVTAKDGNGGVLSETAMTRSPAQRSFMLPFDTTNNVNTGLALFNPSSEPVSVAVDQLDPAGNLIASTQSQPLGPGGHMTAYVSDLFPRTAGVQGALSVTAIGSAGAAVAVLGLRQNTTALAMASTPVESLPLTGSGINVTPTLDSKSQAKAAITPAGGTLSLTDAKGNKFTLTIPANALLSTTTVTMTAVTAVSGLPTGGSFNAGVQLDPDGLGLFEPALLTIEPSSAVPPDLVVPLGWHGAGQGLHLNLVQPQAGKLTLVLTHFSGASFATGPIDNWASAKVLNLANWADLDESDAAYWTGRAHDDAVWGRDSSAHSAEAQRIFNGAYDDWVEPLMRLAEETEDDDLLRCAATQAVNYQHQRELLGMPPNDSIGTAIRSFFQKAMATLQKHAMDRCTKKHDPLAIPDVVATARQAALFGDDSIDVLGVLSQCPSNPLLNFQSEMSGTGTVDWVGNLGDAKITVNANYTVDLTVAAMFALQGMVTQNSLNRMGDGYLTYQLSGSGALKYQNFSGDYKVVQVVTDPSNSGVTINCSGKIVGGTGSTFSVVSPSEIKYQASPKFNPKAVRKNGKLLCDFCPVYQMTPVSVTLKVDPGTPAENSSGQCDGTVSIPVTPGTIQYWKDLWDDNHIWGASRDGNTIANWQIPGPDSFAHKEFLRTLPYTDPAPPPFSGTTQWSITEKTKLDLNQQQQ